jgi:hypothetical protein
LFLQNYRKVSSPWFTRSWAKLNEEGGHSKPTWPKESWKKSFRRPSTYQQSLVSVPDSENRVSYVPELSKPSIFSSSLVLIVVFDDVAAGPACQAEARRLARRRPRLPSSLPPLSPQRPVGAATPLHHGRSFGAGASFLPRAAISPLVGVRAAPAFHIGRGEKKRLWGPPLTCRALCTSLKTTIKTNKGLKIDGLDSSET